MIQFHRTAYFAAFATCMAFASSAHAVGPDVKMKPGLWDMTMKSDAFKNMPRMSKEQADQMRKMGMEVPEFRDGGMISKVCITPEMAEKMAPGVDEAETGCTTKNFKRSGNTYRADLVCNGDAMQGMGVLTGSFTGNERFTSTLDFKGKAAGQQIAQKHETTGKWISADCGKHK